MKATHIIILLSLLLAVMACTRHSEVSDTLARAEAMMEEHPDSALSILEAIPDSALASDRDRALHALHALLLTQALDKNYIDVTSDSLINIAVEYYSKTSNTIKKALSLYYLSRVQYNDRNLSGSLISLMDANEELTDSNAYVLKGLIYRGMSDIYRDIYNAPLYKESATKALSFFEKSKDVDYINYAKLDLAGAYIAVGELQKAVNLASEVYVYANEKSDSNLIYNSIIYIGNAYFGMNEYKKAIESYELIISLQSPPENIYLNLIDSYLMTGREQDATNLKYSIESNYDSSRVSHMAYAHLKDWENAYNAVVKELSSQDSAFRIMVEQSVVKSVIEAQKNHTINEIKNINHQHSIHIFYLVTAILVLSIIIVVLYNSRKKRLLKEKIAILEIKNVKELLVLEKKRTNVSQQKLEEMQKSIHELFNKRFEELDNQIQLYFECETADVSKKRARLANSIIGIIKSFREDENRLRGIENNVDLYLNNLMSDFRKEYSSLRKEEYLLFLYLVIGFSPKAIAVFMDIDLPIFYNRKSRLKKKIKDGNSPSKDKFLNYIV